MKLTYKHIDPVKYQVKYQGHDRSQELVAIQVFDQVTGLVWWYVKEKVRNQLWNQIFEDVWFHVHNQMYNEIN